MMDTKHRFTSCIEIAVKEIRRGFTFIEKAAPSSSKPNQLIRLDLWCSPDTVIDYRESDFTSCLNAEDRKHLNSMVTAFRKLTQTLNAKCPVPKTEGEKAARLVMQIHEIITQPEP